MRILAASWVVPAGAPPIRRGRVAVEAGRIVWVGSPLDAGAPDAPLLDLGDGVLLPGLVNAHCHLELSALAGRVDRSHGFVPWVASLVEARDAGEAGDERAAIAGAIRQMEESGTAAVGDVSNRLPHLDLLAASSLSAVVFHELLGWDPGAAAGILEAADARLAALRQQGLRPDVRLAAHALYSVSPALFEGLGERGGPAALHLAESDAETRFLAGGEGEWSVFLRQRGLGQVAFRPPRTSPVAYAASLGLLKPGLLAAHCVHVDAAACRTLARAGVSVVLCPRSNQELDVGVAPVADLLEAGVELSLGTDSLASVPTLNLLDDVVALHRQVPALDPAVIIRLATAGGARALGLAELGAIAPGRRSALAFAPASRTPRDPLAYLVSGDARLSKVVI